MKTSTVKTIQITAVLRYAAGQHMAKTLAAQGNSAMSIKKCVFGWVNPTGVICKVRNAKTDHWNIGIVTKYDDTINRFICNRGIVKHAVPLSIMDHIVI